MDPTRHTPRSNPEELPPRAARLLAYLDGELGSEDRSRVEAWLADDPTARRQFDSERRLRDLLDAAPVPEPAANVWDETLAGIESRLHPPGSRRPLSPRRSPILWLGAGLAAAAVLAIWLGAGRVNDLAGEMVEPLEVAMADDVTIDDMDPVDASLLVVGRVPGSVSEELRLRQPLLVSRPDEIAVESMNGADADRLVIGEPPVLLPLEMASPGEVQEVTIESADTGASKPYLWPPAGSVGMPMINVRLKTARKD